MERIGHELGGGGWSELGMNWEAGVGARGNKLGGVVGANWEYIWRVGVWSELGMDWEVGVGANWE